jgi:NADH dehydrogenase
MTSNLNPPRVVIVGGGFGGLYAARGLADVRVQVTILDKHNYHLFRPMLYQVATGLLSADEIAAPIRSIFRRQKNVEVFMDEVVGVDPRRQFVQTPDRSLHCDASPAWRHGCYGSASTFTFLLVLQTACS